MGRWRKFDELQEIVDIDDTVQVVSIAGTALQSVAIPSTESSSMATRKHELRWGFGVPALKSEGDAVSNNLQT